MWGCISQAWKPVASLRLCQFPQTGELPCGGGAGRAHWGFLLWFVSPSCFLSQTVFLIWNSLNDPLFGWLSDRVFLSTQQPGAEISSPEVVLKRLRALSHNGPLFAISFLAFWVAWAHPGVQFLLCLCMYDSFLTMVDLHHNALLADLAVSARDRTSLNFYCSLFSAIGSLSVFMSYTVWNKEDFFSFRIFCVVLALCSIVGFTLSTQLLRQRFEADGKAKWDQESTLKQLYIEKHSVPQEKRITLAEYLQQLKRHRNFLWFVCMNLVQVFHCHFNSNFFPLFLEHLLSDQISVSTGSFLLGVSYIAPHLNNLYFLSLCRRCGVYAVVRGLFFLKLALSVVMLLAGPNQVYLLCIFIASNRVFTEGTCKLLNLVVTDLVDEDLVLNRRKQAGLGAAFWDGRAGHQARANVRPSHWHLAALRLHRLRHFPAHPLGQCGERPAEAGVCRRLGADSPPGLLLPPGLRAHRLCAAAAPHLVAVQPAREAPADGEGSAPRPDAGGSA
uniref:Major facilitator superfamily domain containing 13A n=1 Tax=Anas platyrhynchos TaxID=8839 RepID=A0A8B9SJ41_ANAPL